MPAIDCNASAAWVRRSLLAVSASLIFGACSSDASSNAASVTVDVSTAVAPSAETSSAGCTSSTVVPGREEVTLTLEGDNGGDVEYTYLRNVPQSAVAGAPLPVVMQFHGFRGDAVSMAEYSGLEEYGDEQGFITVTPNGRNGILQPLVLDSIEMRFIAAVLDDIESDLCVDTSRIFGTGISQGGAFTSSVACALSDRFAAVAPIAGVFVPNECAPTRPVPVVAFHGTEDHNITYEGNGGDIHFPGGAPVPEMMDAWATGNGCSATTTDAAIGADVHLIEYDCPVGAEVQLYRIDGGGHTWPGRPLPAELESTLGTTTMTVIANEVMWEFFQQHPLLPG